MNLTNTLLSPDTRIPGLLLVLAAILSCIALAVSKGQPAALGGICGLLLGGAIALAYYYVAVLIEFHREGAALRVERRSGSEAA